MINFEKYYEPIVAGKITENEIHKLWQNIAPHLRKAVKTVYLRQVSSDQWKKLESADKEQNSFCEYLKDGCSVIQIYLRKKTYVISFL